MVQTTVVYTIVALAAAWLVWQLFLPASLRNRIRPGRSPSNAGSPGCGDGCGSCSACPSAKKSLSR